VSIRDLTGIAIGCVLLALGSTAMVAWTLRRKSVERLLPIFGAACIVYGARLLAQQPSVESTIGGPKIGWLYAIVILTYLINVLGGLFIEGLVGPGWRGSIRLAWQLQTVYAVVAIVTDVATGVPGKAMPANNPIVLVGVVIAVINIRIYRSRINPFFKSPVVVAGAAAFALFVINENLGRPVLPAIGLEPVGIMVFVSSLGYAVVGSVLSGEAELAAVQRELATARQIQQSLLPREPPRVNGLEVAIQYRPMTAVAGDLYDFVVLAPSRLGILVADVAGHGVPAALVASMVKLAFSTQADRADDPAAVLTAMNRILCRHVERTFVTAVYAVLDTERSTLTVANAGHPALLLGRTDGVIDDSEARGLMLGMMERASYSNDERPLRRGDRVLLYTDGVSEAQNARGDFFDGERVRNWLSHDGDAGMMSDAALQDLRQWRATDRFDDDVTFVIARVT
jgi:hypothetical protein